MSGHASGSPGPSGGPTQAKRRFGLTVAIRGYHGRRANADGRLTHSDGALTYQEGSALPDLIIRQEAHVLLRCGHAHALCGERHRAPQLRAQIALLRWLSQDLLKALECGHMSALQWAWGQPEVREQILLAACSFARAPSVFAVLTRLHALALEQEENLDDGDDTGRNGTTKAAVASSVARDLLRDMLQGLREARTAQGRTGDAAWLGVMRAFASQHQDSPTAGTRVIEELEQCMQSLKRLSETAAGAVDGERFQHTDDWRSMGDAGAASGHVPIVEWLLANNAGITPDAIKRAAASGSLHMLEFASRAVQERCGVDNGITPDVLTVAGGAGSIRIVEWLLSCHSEVVGDSCIEESIVEAAKHGHAAVFELLLRKRNLSESDKPSEAYARCIEHAAGNNHLALLQLLCRRWLQDGDDDAFDGVARTTLVERGICPGLHVAITRRHKDVVRFIVEQDIFMLNGTVADADSAQLLRLCRALEAAVGTAIRNDCGANFIAFLVERAEFVGHALDAIRENATT